jgi:predicted nucleotidyltransferase
MTEGFTPYSEVNQIISLVLTRAQEVLQEQFVGMYLYGSLATGGFNLRTSDIDFAIVTETTLPDEIIARIEAIHMDVWDSSLKWAQKLEGSYLPKTLIRRHDPNGSPCPTINEGSFYLDRRGSDWIIQRHIIREYGIIIAGLNPKSLIDPVSPEEIRQAVVGVLKEWWFPMLENPAWLKERGSEYHAYAVISMCRALHVVAHGTIISKPAATRWAREKFPEWNLLIHKAEAAQHGSQGEFLMEALEFMKFTKGIILTSRRE